MAWVEQKNPRWKFMTFNTQGICRKGFVLDWLLRLTKGWIEIWKALIRIVKKNFERKIFYLSLQLLRFANNTGWKLLGDFSAYVSKKRHINFSSFGWRSTRQPAWTDGLLVWHETTRCRLIFSIVKFIKQKSSSEKAGWTRKKKWMRCQKASCAVLYIHKISHK